MKIIAGGQDATRKHILRTAIVEIVAKIVGDTIDLVVHWQGGDHTQLTVPKNRAGRHRWTTEAETSELIRALARQQPDAGIAAILNRCGKCTGKGNSWTESRVRSHRSAHGIAVYRDGEKAERGELTLEEAARRLTVSKMTVLRLIGRGAIQARQVCKGAPHGHPGGDPCLWRTGLPQALSARALRTRMRGPPRSCARGLRRSRCSRPGRPRLAWTGSGTLPQGRDRTSVGCERDGAALPPVIATPRVDTVASPRLVMPSTTKRAN